MQQSTAATDTQDAQAIPPVTPDEAVTMASVELDRFLALIASLTAQEWEAPTDCTLWNVRQVVAHVAGALTAYADEHLLLQRIGPWLGGPQGGPGMTMALFIADVTGMPQARRDAYRDLGLNPLDALNQYQVDEREHATPQELMEEIRAAGPAAIANRRSMPDSIRDIQLPVTGVMAPVHYLTDVIYPRDMWMHRMEIALATGRSIARTSDHEGRLTALVMRDLARRLARSLGNRTVVYHLAGPDGGRFRFGGGQEPDTVLSMDAVHFHLLASSRRALEALTVDISGDGELARQILGETTVGY